MLGGEDAAKVSVIVISKDEPALAATLDALQAEIAALGSEWSAEVLVVDASEGRLDDVRATHPWARWVDFQRPPGVGVSIPHQRNRGLGEAQGDIIVFTDAGCTPVPGWLPKLVQPVADGSESATCGPAWVGEHMYGTQRGEHQPEYVEEAATINLAVSRDVFEVVGGFDERFAYGSDVDFSWRAVSHGFRLRWLPEAAVVHDWGTFRRNLKRSRQYGAARVRLYAKHRDRARRLLRDDPVIALYPLYMLAAPFFLLRGRFGYFSLLLLPLYRNRRRPHPERIVVFHLAEGVGSLQECWHMVRVRLAQRAELAR